MPEFTQQLPNYDEGPAPEPGPQKPERPPLQITHTPQTLEEIPLDAHISERTALTCWNGKEFVTWNTWLFEIQDRVDEREPPPYPPRCSLTAEYPYEQRVWLLRRGTEGERYVMFVQEAGKRVRRRRRDFASPSQDHSVRTAEFWYGKPLNGWHKYVPAKRPPKQPKG